MNSEARKLVRFIRSVGVDVHTSTKARGNQGFFLKNRIDISKNIPEERVIPTLIHEFTHYIHSKIEPFMEKTGGTVEKIFDDDEPRFYADELLEVTKFVDKNSKFETLNYHKELLKNEISDYEEIIKARYPDFMRSKDFKEFDKYIKNSDAKYLLKYDRIKLVKRGLKSKTAVYSVDNIEEDFPGMPKEFCAYIRLKSCQKKQSRISSKINRLTKYYSRPTELFARLTEGIYINSEQIKKLAPNCYKRFFELLNCGYYKELSGLSDYFKFIME